MTAGTYPTCPAAGAHPDTFQNPSVSSFSDSMDDENHIALSRRLLVSGSRGR